VGQGGYRGASLTKTVPGRHGNESLVATKAGRGFERSAPAARVPPWRLQEAPAGVLDLHNGFMSGWRHLLASECLQDLRLCGDWRRRRKEQRW